MTKSDVKAYFDALAPLWDEGIVKDERKIKIILDNAGIKKGSKVLDVACGTGILFPYYLARGAYPVVGVDISNEMIRIACKKFGKNPDCCFICGDAETTEVGDSFDSIVVYNAFPHFPHPEALISRLSGLLKCGGILTVAHGLSREEIDACHNGAASGISMGLMPAESLAVIFSHYLKLIKIISNSEMYQICGKKK